MSKKLLIVLTIVMMLTMSFSAIASFPATFEDMFMELYNDINDPANGYFSAEGIPYHSVEELIVEAPDYGHVTTSEAYSYYIWLEAMYGLFTGDWSTLNESWENMETYIIPDFQDGLQVYNPNEPATYAAEYATDTAYPSPLRFDAPVGQDPIHDELVSTYGTYDIYGMHWLLDVDNWYEYGEGTEPVLINTFQRGAIESVWRTVPHPSIETFDHGGTYGFLDLFIDDDNYARQWRYTAAPDADARAIQAVYWAREWAQEQGRVNEISEVIDKAAMLGDYMRYALFDKYFKPIGENVRPETQGATGYDSAHYLLSWYYSWGGGMDGYWAFKIGSSHAHFGYQNPMAAWVLANDSDFMPLSRNGARDWGYSYDRQLEFYMWLQASNGAIGGGATNAYVTETGDYSPYPAGSATFYGMKFEEHPVYRDPGSNEWIGMQGWSMQRIAELYYVTGDLRAKHLLDNWVPWIVSEIQLPSNDHSEYYIPATLEWHGQPETWRQSDQGSMTWDNPNFTVEVTGYGQDLGIVGSLANALIYYAAATERHEGRVDEAALDAAHGLIDRVWLNARTDKGLAIVEARGDYERFFEEIYIPAGWSGTMGNGDVIEPGVRFIDIRSKYKSMPEFAQLEAAVNAGEDPEFMYHRYWAQADLALAMGKLAHYFPERKPGDTLGIIIEPDGGDLNGDGVINSLDMTLLQRYILTMIGESDIVPGSADVNGDGVVNSLDVVALRNIIYNQ
ncbi:glycoside hydrolase family 48 protein [Natronospora cellulosivora (SeqCode)]